MATKKRASTKTVAKKASKTKSAVLATAKAGKLASSAAARRAEELIDLIVRRKQRIAEDFYDIGVALHELEKKKLYAPLGYASFSELLEKHKLMSVSSASKLMAIVGAMSRDRALPLGSEKAYALARLVENSPDLTTVDQALEQGVKVKGKTVRVNDLSRREIEKLAKKARKPSAVPAQDRAAIAAAKEAQRVLRRAGAPHAHAKDVRRGGTWWVQLELSVDELDVVLRRVERK